MQQIESAASLRDIVQQGKSDGLAVGLVPTMGYLHNGHLRLVDEARTDNDLVIMSLFVNPTQFGPHEDFERYPRDAERDRRLAELHGVDVLFMPDMDEMYPEGPEAQTVWIDPGPLARHLEGAARPGHFRGVATVVAKLFHMALPDRAYFGQKDAQQALIITRMVRDLAFPLDVHVVPTVRESDGLALSSRNVYLSPDQRGQAPALSWALSVARQRIEAGERDAHGIEGAMHRCLAEAAPLGRVEYALAADLETLEPVQGRIERDCLISLAVTFGTTRLIDNVIVRFGPAGPTFS